MKEFDSLHSNSMPSGNMLVPFSANNSYEQHLHDFKVNNNSQFATGDTDMEGDGHSGGVRDDSHDATYSGNMSPPVSLPAPLHSDEVLNNQLTYNGTPESRSITQASDSFSAGPSSESVGIQMIHVPLYNRTGQLVGYYAARPEHLMFVDSLPSNAAQQYTALSMEPNSMNSAARLPRTSNTMDRLRALPKLRPIPWKNDVQHDPATFRLYEQKCAILLSTRGEVSDSACKYCSKGLGYFEECVRIGDWFNGACASCIWNRKGKHCTLRDQILSTALHGKVEEKGPKPGQRDNVICNALGKNDDCLKDKSY